VPISREDDTSNEQDTAAQMAALKATKCERIYREQASGGRWDRPELQRLLDQLRKGDVLVVWKLDRLSRSLRDVLTIMERLSEARVGFRSLTEAIDTTTPAGRMMMKMVGAFAEFERAMLRERTRAGLEAARRDGRIGGRRPKLTTQQQAEIISTISRGDKTAADAARLFNVHPATISRLLARTGGSGVPRFGKQQTRHHSEVREFMGDRSMSGTSIRNPN
jgi:DNA invertase Pin-like site-specific DNA recombinase